MTTTSCTRCGTDLLPDGLCPRCLVDQVVRTGPPRPPRELPTREELERHFPAYEIGELLGQGGMGMVYAARQKELGRDVALKLLAPEVAAEPGFSERFRREARVLASLQHPGIVTVYDFGSAGPWFFFAMERVVGKSLRELISTRALGPKESLVVVAQICEVLQYAHDQGVVHRDIKPENVFVDSAGRVRLLDFGLSKICGEPARENLTRTDQVMGTVHYMAPEQWERPADVDHRADIFALGVVFYELLTGELPVGRFEPPSQRVQVDVRLDEIVLRSLERDRERRYQQALEVRTDVQRVEPVAASAPAAPERAKTPENPGLSEVRPADRPRTRAQAFARRLASARGNPPPRRERERLPVLFYILAIGGFVSFLLSAAAIHFLVTP